jgi:hypothetical protein
MARHAKPASLVALAAVAGREHGIRFAQIGGADPFRSSAATVATSPKLLNDTERAVLLIAD